MTGPMEARSLWRNRHGITDWELGQIGRLLTEHDPRDLALKLVRLQGQYEVSKQLIETMTSTHTAPQRHTTPPLWPWELPPPGAAAGVSQNAASGLPPLYHPDSERPPPLRPVKKGT